MSEKEVVDILRRTRELLVEKGRWTKGSYSTSDDRYCLVGGIERVMGACHSLRQWRKAYDHLAHVIEEQYPDRMGGQKDIEVFNDHLGTELTDIGLVLDKAILLAEEEA